MVKFDCWQAAEHSVHFDSRKFYPTFCIKEVYRDFNEFVLLRQNVSAEQSFSLVDIGCATGEMSRCLRQLYPKMDYTGYDISKVAIERATVKYPNEKYVLTDTSLSALEGKTPDYLFSRDVVLHQEDPFGFLKTVSVKPTKGMILRLRTRDTGKTFLDFTQSCQFYNGQWAPYILINCDELVDFLKSFKRFSKITILKNYMPLGGLHFRYIPKDCYFEEAGTAETAVYAEVGANVENPEVIIEKRTENDAVPLVYRMFSRLLRTAVGGQESRVWW